MSLNAQASEHLEWNTDILGVGALGNGYFLNESTSSRNSIRRDRDSKNALDGGYQMLKSPRGRVNDLSRPSMTEGNGQRSRMESPTYSTTPASAKSQGKLRDHSSTNHSDTQSSLASDDVFTITDGKFDDQQPGDMSEIDLAVPTPAPLQAPSGYGSTTVYAPEALQNLSAWPLQPDAEPNLIGTRPPSHTGPAGESGSALSLPQNLPKPSPKKVASVFPQSSEGVATTSKLIPVIYQPLVTSLQQYRSKGVHKVPRSKFAEELVKRHPGLYQRAGVLKFSQYVVLAQKAGIIRLGGKDGNEWISLRPSVA
ncbi:hypothetical protein H0H93_010293 [Arthromyces matolae]|nr:hypothetical protein H0H93_010293 [Arthromyces matolae]